MFRRFVDWWIYWLGHPIAFVIAAISCIVWAAAGPIFGWSDTWQLVINTATTVITFLMLFLVQSSQNRDTQSLHAKLDQIVKDIPEVKEDEIEV